VGALRAARVVAAAALAGAALPAAASDAAADAEALYTLNCLACHGADLRGLDGAGVPLAGSRFVAARSVAELVAFLKAGRLPDATDSVAGRAMPAFAWLPEPELAAIAAWVKARGGG
jgi:mono/diheme cytochrome c family protein